MNFPTLYQKGIDGMLEWTVSTKGVNIITVHGRTDGKLQTASKRAEPKNIGRANATTAAQQAESEAQSMFDHKLKTKYARTKEEAEKPRFTPMLAHKWQDYKTGMIYPVYVQPKLDGFRCLAFKEDGEVTLFSRGGEVFSLPHISEELKRLPDGTVLDGELYCHGVTFQQVTKWIKKARPETFSIHYHVYDMPHESMTMRERLQCLNVLAKHQWLYIDVVETRVANNSQEVEDTQRLCIEAGYEGAIVRTQTGLYRWNKRSTALLKVKTFDDAEFRITGGRPGIGKYKTFCIFSCITKDGKEFNVMPRGDASVRAEYLTNLKKYVGRELKVKYFGLSEDGVPRFPVGIAIREKFDK